MNELTKKLLMMVDTQFDFYYFISFAGEPSTYNRILVISSLIIDLPTKMYIMPLYRKKNYLYYLGRENDFIAFINKR